MNFYTKEWVEYIYKEWINYVKFNAFFSDYNAKNLEIYDGYFDDKLREEFDKYYNAKKKYISMYSELEEKFGDYERIKIKSYEEEFDDYRNRVRLYADELRNTIKKNIGIDKFSEIENIDFSLLLLGYVNSCDYDNVIKYYKKIFNKANSFLICGYGYDEYLKNYIDEEFFDIWFHDCELVDIQFNKNDVTLVIEDGYYPYDKVYYLTLVDVVKNDIDKKILPFVILGLDVYYINNKFYLYIDEDYFGSYELVCSKILLDIKNKGKV